ncbi:MAG: Ig-like domain-containing protein [Armatimonadetes bacterium]|nr:Ig-like domain-containing protein [Armatimonadota bacterium]
MKRTRRAISMIVTMAMMAPSLATAAEAAMVNWLSPAPGQRITVRTVEVAVGYNTQSDQKVTSLELWVDGKMHARKYLIHPDTRGVCSFVWDTARFSDGPHDLIVKVYSGDQLLSKVTSTGTVGSSAFDMDPPVVTFMGIKSGDVLKGTSDIKIKATDDSGEPPLVSLLVDDSLKLIKNRAPYVYALDTTTYKNGSHELETFAYDGAGNKSNPSVVNVTFNNNVDLPVVTSVDITPNDKIAPSEDDGTSTSGDRFPGRSPSKIITAAPVAKVAPAAVKAPKTQAARVADSIPKAFTTAAKPAAAQPIAAKRPSRKLSGRSQDKFPGRSQTPIAEPVAKPVIKSAPKTVQAPVSAPAKISAPTKPIVLKPIIIASRPPAELAPLAVSAAPIAAPSTIVPEIISEHSIASSSGTALEPKLEAASSVSNPLPILMAKAPDLRNDMPKGLLSPASSIAAEMLSDPISSAPSKTSVTGQSANLRAASQAGCASVGKRIALAPKTPSLAKPDLAPYVADANARAKVKSHLQSRTTVKIEHSAKLEKRVLPVSGKAKVRDLVNNGGGILFWDAQNHAATAYVGNMELELTVGSDIALVNGKEMKIESAPYIANGRMIINAQVYQQALAIANSTNVSLTASAK